MYLYVYSHSFESMEKNVIFEQRCTKIRYINRVYYDNRPS